MMDPREFEAIIKLLKLFVAILILLFSMRLGRIFYLFITDFR
jgi:hypothetical protein